MLLKADNIEDARLKGQQYYRCNIEQVRVTTVRLPKSMFWGLIKWPGIYNIECMPSINSENNDADSETFNYRDGYAEIVDGKVKIADPIGNGRYASIIADDENIEVYVNGERIKGKTVVSERDQVELKPVRIEPKNEIKVELSDDKMQAILTINRLPGKQYYVKDAVADNSIYVHSDYKEISVLDITLVQCLQALKQAGVIWGIDVEAISELLKDPNGGSMVVARGTFPVDGVDGKVKYMFRNSSYRNPDFDTDKTVDLLEHTIIPTVEVGDLLAVKTVMAIPGKDGRTVTGEVIKARPARDMLLKAGNGVVLLDNGTKAVAAIAGRPVLKKGVISVIPVLTIQSNVDAQTGNIHFEGDIIVNGNILEGMDVTAGGSITVYGSISHAMVRAKGDIRVYGKIIGSRVTAGTDIVNYSFILPRLERILVIIEDIYDKIDKISPSDDHGDLGQRLFSLVKKTDLQRLIKEMDEMMGLLANEDDDKLGDLLKRLRKTFTGLWPLHVQNVDDIKVLLTDLQAYVESIKTNYGYQANVIFEYGQNSFIQASGNIVVDGQGCFYTDLVAKNGIVFKKASSIARGGRLIAGKAIKAGIVGSPVGVATYCRVLDKKGKIDASFYYNNTVVIIGDVKTVVGSDRCSGSL